MRLKLNDEKTDPAPAAGPVRGTRPARRSTGAHSHAKGKICYQYTGTIQSASKDSLNARAARWLQYTFPETPNPLQPATDGHLRGSGIFKVPTSADGHYYWLQFAIDIAPAAGGYSAQFSDYYEKPIEPGITNDWSKIGYRWWDYRQGKPWSVEDNTLFAGLHTQSKALLDSLWRTMAGQ